MTTKMKLSILLGLAFDGALDLESIAAALGGKRMPEVQLHHPQFAAHEVWQYLVASDWWAESRMHVDPDNAEFIQGWYASINEVFASSNWGRGASKRLYLTLLGHDCSEEDIVLPDDWHEFWHPLALCEGWALYYREARTGTLYRLSYSDEGFNYDVWMYVRREYTE